MLSRRLIAASLTALSILGASVVLGQKESPGPALQTLDPDAISIRILFGIGETEPLDWSGSVSLDKGDVLGVEGWRFRQDDKVVGMNSWEATTRPNLGAGKKAVAKKKAANAVAAVAGPNGVIVTLKAPNEATLTFRSQRGSFTVALADLAGAAKPFLDGKVMAQRVPQSVLLTNSPDQDDFPAASADPRGSTWVAYVVHKPRGPATLGPLAERPKGFEDATPKGGGDQVKLLKYSGGKAGIPLDVTADGLDVWRPSLAVLGDGSLVVAWSENKEGNFDIYSRNFDPIASSWSEVRRLTTNPGSDADVVLATAPDGKAWMAWQSWKNGKALIQLAPVASPEIPATISDPSTNSWSPSLAIDKGGRVHVAFDTYLAGNYDVHLRTRNVDGTLGSAVAVADSAYFEARPSLAIDSSGRLWVAYEERDKDWGKDAENLTEGEGASLYRGSAVRVRCLDGEQKLDTPDPVFGAPAPLRVYNSFPRINVDRSGRVWLAFRHRLAPQNNAIGGVWIGQVTSLSGKAWTPLAALTRSDGMLDNRASMVVPSEGLPQVVYAGDGRLNAEGNVIDARLSIAALKPISEVIEPVALAAIPPRTDGPVKLLHANEAKDIARLRDYKIESGGKSYWLLRGEFHRHTEISQDGGSDGALEDMWRYAIDVAGLDWIGNGDHDNGGHKEYTWWLIQKSTDLYHSPAYFMPMFTYERSVVFPHGHRNVMFDHRGIRTLPRLQAAEGKGVAGPVAADDTKMLYDYLKALGGITASHTSATTGMGTDWRDNDSRVEPIVEIFQGHRNSYEHLGAPRVGRSNAEAVAGMQPAGMVWNALALNYKLGFQASSDHVSTHISYAIALVENPGRAGILDAFKRRHCYAATDNILLDVRSGDHLMGDEFEQKGPLKLKVVAHGTKPIARVDIIKDFVYVYSTEPKTERVEFTWTDTEKRPAGLSWYYVRVIQEDGELAWGSPIWVQHGPTGGGE